MSYKPIAPAPSGSNHTPPGSSVPSPSLPSNFRPAFSDFGPPSMGFVQVSFTRGRWSGSVWRRQRGALAHNPLQNPSIPCLCIGLIYVSRLCYPDFLSLLLH
uniref:Uncharacterized protein n=1 Tax=Oncorhynchus tshawytscha TaxID=74940 RepID=A0A8C8BZ59_ONCTS